ncbi:MAG: hypothetical protein WCE64_09735 [Bacteroidales bacterium]
MENDDKIMTGEESLKIITEMITRTKANIRQGSFHLLFWGWLIVFCSLVQFLLMKYTHVHAPWNVWLLVIPGIFVSLIYGWRKGRQAHVHTYADMIYMMTWIGFAIVYIILLIFLHGRGETIPSFTLLIAGLPTFLSGFIVKFRPLILGGIAFWIFSLISFFAGPDVSQLTVPVAMITGYLIPGYLLRRKDSHDAV